MKPTPYRKFRMSGRKNFTAGKPYGNIKLFSKEVDENPLCEPFINALFISILSLKKVTQHINNKFPLLARWT
jgi:hypothetical protein